MKRRASGALAALALFAAACDSHKPDPITNPVPPVDSGPPGSCTITPPTPNDWRLHADGTLLRDELGRVVLLRGVDAGGRSKFAPYVPFDFADGGYATALSGYMDLAASWGIDAMRVPFTWAALEPAQGQQDSGWLAMYDQLLDAAWAHGIYTVVDFHQDVYSEVFCGDGFPGWTVPDAGPPHHDCGGWQLEYFQNTGMQAAFDAFWDAGSPVQAAYASAWDTMVARYKDKPGVIGFEPINEPGWGTEDENTFSATTLTAFYGMMVQRMRAAAPSSLVFVDPPGYDGTVVQTSLTKPAGDGIVFAPHYYPIVVTMDPVAGLGTWQKIGAAWNVPVFLGEFGASYATPTSSLTYMQSIWNALDTLGMSGTEWEYSIAAAPWNMETDGLVSADGGENPVAAAVLRPFARAIAGSAITQSFDPASRTYTLTFTFEAGPVSEVSLPARAYPNGHTVTVSGACFDETSKPGTLLLSPTGSPTNISLTVSATQ
jgi:endoglycosylceramidase